MVIGEAEIQGQVKRSYEAALERETAGPLTRHLFQAALQTGKRVRSETAIGERAMSLPAVGVTLARELLGDIKGRTVVIVGTGETSELAARALASSGCHTVFVATRRRDRAISLANAFNGDSVSFDELPEALAEADIVVAATSSPHLLIEAEELAAVMRAREDRPLLMIDLAVPRDVDADCAGIPGVSLYDIDDLQTVIKRNRKVRQAEAQRAEGIIEEEIQHFASWMGALEILPTIKALRTRANEIASSVIDDNAGKWESASDKDLERMEAMARSLVNRLLEQPTVKMKELRDDRVHARMALVRELFGLDASEQEYDEQSASSEPQEPLAEVRVLPQRR
jgi:glutamyl-tRNA reductase